MKYMKIFMVAVNMKENNYFYEGINNVDYVIFKSKKQIRLPYK